MGEASELRALLRSDEEWMERIRRLYGELRARRGYAELKTGIPPSELEVESDLQELLALVRSEEWEVVRRRLMSTARAYTEVKALFCPDPVLHWICTKSQPVFV